MHKVLGWALTDVVTVKDGGCHALADPRINADSRLLSYEDEFTAVEYARFLAARDAARDKRAEGEPVSLADRRQGWLKEATLDRWALFEALSPTTDPKVAGKRDRSSLSPNDAVYRHGEYGDPSVLVIRPLTLTDWHRRDDSLDYAAESMSARAGENYATVLPHAPYPFSGLFMDSAVGLRLPDEVMPWVRLQSRLRDEPDLDEATRSQIVQAMEVIATKFLGFEDGQAAMDRIAPCVPGEVRALAEFGQVFTSGDVWRQLRPVLYTYWS